MTDERIKIQEKIVNHLIKSSHRDIKNINFQTLLFREGIFDSMGFITLIDFIENEIGIDINDEELVEDNFESIAAITDFILKKRSVLIPNLHES